jgi:hypothetical protein
MSAAIWFLHLRADVEQAVSLPQRGDADLLEQALALLQSTGKGAPECAFAGLRF